MRFILATLLIALLSFLAGLFLPWWSLAVVAFVIAFLFLQRLSTGFLSGFLGVFMMWGILSLWIDVKNESILSHKIAQLLPLGGSSILLIVVTGFVGALVGGFAAMAGTSLRPAKRVRRY